MPEQHREIAIIENSTSVELCEGFKLTTTGCIVSGEPTLQAYGEALERCGRLANATQWALGDLIIYGEGRGDWGEMYSQYVDLSARSYAQVSQAARVSREFPPGEMRQYATDLSWSHHRVLISHDREDRITLLCQAQDNDWNVEALRQAACDLRDLHAVATGEDGAPLVEVLAEPEGPALSVQCVNEESASALVRWCEQFPAEYTVGR